MNTITTDAKSAIKTIETGHGPVRVSQVVANEIAKLRPAFFGSEVKDLRLAAFGLPPYTPEAWQAFEILIGPSPDVIGREEQKVEDKYAEGLAAAAADEAAAQAAFEVADDEWTGAIAAPKGREPILVTFGYQLIPPSRKARKAEERAKATIAEAWERRLLAETNLQNAQRVSQRTNNAYELARGIARHIDAGGTLPAEEN